MLLMTLAKDFLEVLRSKLANHFSLLYLNTLEASEFTIRVLPLLSTNTNTVLLYCLYIPLTKAFLKAGLASFLSFCTTSYK